MKPISRNQMANLAKAIQAAKAWRGSYMPEHWPHFDEEIKEMEDALLAVRKLNAWVKINQLTGDFS